MESVGRSYSRHFSAFLVDENEPPMPSQPVHQPRPARAFAAAPPAHARPSGAAGKKASTHVDDDIPVLESGSTAKTAFYSDGEDDDDDDDDEYVDGDGDEGCVDAAGAKADDGLENVAVLETAEDAQALGGKAPTKTDRSKPPSGTLRKLRDVATTTTRRAPDKAALNNGAAAAAGAHSPQVFDRKASQISMASTNSMASSGSSGSAYGRGSVTGGGSSSTSRVMVRSGWLVRQGQHLKTWKRRYFVLIKRTNLLTGETSASLQYYKGSNFGKLRGEIHLHDGGPLTVRFVDVGESKKPFCFGISRGEFSLYCQGKDDEDVSAWVWHLQSLASPTTADGTDRNGVLASTSRGTLAALASVASLGNRGIFITAELRRLLHNSKSPEAAKCKNFIKSFECRSTSSLRQLRELHATVTESIMRIHGARIIAMTEEKAQIEQQSGYANGGEPLKLADLQVIASRHVEDVVFTPLSDAISTFLRRAFGEDDAILNRKLRWLQGKDQTYYNIPLHQVSSKDWRKASKMLAQAAQVASPTAKYEILVATIKEIQFTFAEEHEQQLEVENPLETDDLIPIFTYVLANSGVDNLLALKLLLSELNGAWAVGGSLDNGAALSILKYAVDFIGTVSIPAVLEDIFRDQITLSIDGEWRQVLELEVEPTYRYGAVVRHISSHGQNTIGASIGRGHVLVTVNGQNVVLWPYTNIAALLKESTAPHRLAFIPSNSYFKILTSNKALWNVALAQACQRGDIASVQMLLANGADVNYVAHESGGNTPLHIAVSALHFNVVSYLLQHGAKAKTLGECGRSALHMVGYPCTLPSSYSTTSQPLTSISMGNSLRQSTSKFQPTDKVVMIIKKLLNHGTPLETTDIFGYTPLMLLSQKGLVNGVDVLVEHSGGDVDLNARNWQHGLGALALAAREGHLDVVEALLDYGVEPDVCDLNGNTPLHFAAAIAAKDICRVLIQRDCDVDVRNRDGVTPLMVAAARTTLLDPVDAKTAKSRERDAQALSSRVEMLYVFETIEYLIEARADLYAVCNLYRLPLHYAAKYGGHEIYQFVKSKMRMDTDCQRRDLFGTTAAVMAEGKREAPASEDGSEDAAGGEETQSRDSQIESQSDFQLLLNSAERPSEMVERRDDLVVEVAEGQRLVVSGTLGAICDELYRFDAYQMDDVEALISTCTVTSYRVLIDYMREALRSTADQPDVGVYVRRMVLHSVDLMVQSFMQKVELDTEVCSCIHEFCTELFPFKLEDDPACGQWLATSFLPMFSEAVRTGRLFDLRVSSPCETAYSSLKSYLKIAKKTSPMLKFLDDDLFASTFGVEVITETMRRRLSIAGVWKGDANRSFLVRSETSESPSVPLTRKTLTSLPLARGRSGVPDRITRVWLLDVDVSVLADQITLFQHYLFSQIRVSEMLESKRSAEKTPAYDRLRQFHNHISIWVVNQILVRDDVEQRVQVLSHFIKVAGVCLHPLQNFDGFMAIMNATNDSSVFRLKKTWNRLSPQVREQWHELKKYTESGARSLHKLMRDAIPPMIPYLGVVMQNIITVQEYPDRVDNGLINFKKIRLLGGVVKRILSLQSSPYLLQIDKRVLDQVCSFLQYPDADTCFNRSLKIEPRIPTS